VHADVSTQRHAQRDEEHVGDAAAAQQVASTKGAVSFAVTIAHSCGKSTMRVPCSTSAGSMQQCRRCSRGRNAARVALHVTKPT
jgi:hypothetical protein